MANSLNTFKGSKNFEPSIKKFILSSSPMYSQQTAIPIEEFDRLQRKFMKYKLNNFKKPEIIVFEKLNSFTKNITIKKKDYCKLYDGNVYIVYLKMEKNVNSIKCN